MRVCILDSQPGAPAESREWEFDPPKITLRDLIRQRVTREVESFNLDRQEVYRGLVQPEDPERKRKLDPDRQTARALEAFRKNRFLVIAAGRQVESLEEEIDLTRGEVEFIKLVPLIGG